MQIFVVSSLGGHSDNVANAMLADDHEGVANAHDALAAAKEQMAEFVNHWQGEMLGDSGEDSCFTVEVQDPEIFLNDLESLKSHISELSAHDLTMGAGESMSDAGKAFLYGKMNGSPEVTVYDESMEQELAEMGGDPEAAPDQTPFYGEENEEEPNQEEVLEEEPNGDFSDEGEAAVQDVPAEEDEVGTDESSEVPEGEPELEDNEQTDPSGMADPEQERGQPVEQIDYENEDGQPEEYKPFLDGAVGNTTAVAISGNEGDAPDPIGKAPYNPSTEINAGEAKEGFDPNAEELDEDPDDMDEDSESYNAEAEKDGEPENEEPELEEEVVEEEPLEESQDSEMIDIPDSKEQKEFNRQQAQDQEGNEAAEGLNHAEGDSEDEQEENPDYTMDEDEDEYSDNDLVNPEEEEENGDQTVADAGREDDGNMMGDSMEELPEGGAMPPEGEMPVDAQQGSQEVGDPNSPMPEEEQVMGDSMSPEDQEYDMADDMANEEQIGEELRQQIASALQGFSSQKEAMMAMQQQAPELYQSTIVLLQTLIEMSNLIFGESEEGEEQPYYEPEPENEETPFATADEPQASESGSPQ